MPKQTDYDPEQDPAYREARKEILEAARTGAILLNLSGRKLTVLPPEIGRLTALTQLYLFDNLLTTLPPEIGRLTALRLLSLDGSQLTALPPEIGTLTALTGLSLDDNQLAALPPEIGTLTTLQVLSLAGNQLTALPPEIGTLTALQVLSLKDNQLTALPPEIGRLSALTELYLHDNPALGLLPEVLGPRRKIVTRGDARPAAPRAILDCYFTRRPGGDRPLNEVKLVLVGRGGAGKTSLVDRLVWDKFEPNQKETLGVKLCDWRMRDCDGGEVLAHVWDFAGQTITHSMHQFFLSVRTVYVLVLTGRENSERENAEYWLRLIAAFGSEQKFSGDYDVGP